MTFIIAQTEHGLVRHLIPERTKAGLHPARARRRRGGHSTSLDVDQLVVAVALYEQRKHTADETCRALNISKPSPCDYVREKRA